VIFPFKREILVTFTFGMLVELKPPTIAPSSLVGSQKASCSELVSSLENLDLTDLFLVHVFKVISLVIKMSDHTAPFIKPEEEQFNKETKHICGKSKSQFNFKITAKKEKQLVVVTNVLKSFVLIVLKFNTASKNTSPTKKQKSQT
jgi:hypothetical protein